MWWLDGRPRAQEDFVQKSGFGIPNIGNPYTMKFIDFSISEQICEGNLAGQKYYSAGRQSQAQICRGHSDGQYPSDFVTIVMKNNMMDNQMDQSPWTTATIQSTKCTSVCAWGGGKHLKHSSNEKKHEGKLDESVTMDNSNNSFKTVFFCVCRMWREAFETQ